MVKALHRAGIEVILDVVFNHTAEGGHDGPTLCYRGLDNDAYYILEKDGPVTRTSPAAATRSTPTSPIVRRMIHGQPALLGDARCTSTASASTSRRSLSRDEEGHLLPNPPVLWDIESDPAAGRHQADRRGLGCGRAVSGRQLHRRRWEEWNGRFRDDVRRFLTGDAGAVSARGRPDAAAAPTSTVTRSVKPSTASTSSPATTASRSTIWSRTTTSTTRPTARTTATAANDNLSWNCGAEGPTDDPTVEALRNRQIKNFLTLTLLSPGTPMILMGDEVRRTQSGNNNAYCQDNEISWFDWSLLERHPDIHRFVKVLVGFRQRRDVVAEDTVLSLNQLLRRTHIEWHGVALKRPDWSDQSHSLAFTLRTLRGRFLLHGMLNAYWEPLTFDLPPVPADRQQGWRRCIDTALEAPDDISPWDGAAVVRQGTYEVQPRSVVFLALALDKLTGEGTIPHSTEGQLAER